MTKYNIKVTNLDYFAFINTLFFLMMCNLVYYQRFIDYRGAANIHEFFIYATVIILTIFFFWLKFRRLDIRFSLLILVEISILLHFSGAFVEIHGHRLYDSRLFDIRYDKLVHFINAMIATLVVIFLFKRRDLPQTPFVLLIAVLTVLGLGAIVEIIEFAVTLTVPHNGVGDYNNNMFDLVANLLGSLSSALLFKYFSQKRIIAID